MEKNLPLYYMSSQTTTSTPSYPTWSPMSAYSYPPDDVLSAMQNQELTRSIYDGSSKVINSVNTNARYLNSEIAGVNSNMNSNARYLNGDIAGVNTNVNNNARFLSADIAGVSAGVNNNTRFLNSEIAGVNAGVNDNTRYLNSAINGISKDIDASALGLRDAIERGNTANVLTTERVGNQVGTAVERNGNAAQVTTERTAYNIASAVDRNGNAAQVTMERNGGNIMTAIERVAGEGRLTTTVTDAATRQAANDSARDVLRAVDRVGADSIGNIKDTYSGLLASIERNAGETRMAGAVAAGNTDFKLADVRHSVLNDVNRGINEVITAGTQNFNVLSKSVTDSAWEARTAMANGFGNLGEEHLRTKFDISKQMSDNYTSGLIQQQKMSAHNSEHYSSLLLEQQKLAAHGTGHYSSLLLEQQKLKEYLSSKGDTHFAMNQLEMQKVKEGLASQAAHNFASTQLEAQKIKECLSAQLADAKYEALKSQQYLGDRIDECCCSVKEKMDVLDRDRLRDNLIVEREDNNLLKILELSDYGRGRGDRGSRGRRGGRR